MLRKSVAIGVFALAHGIANAYTVDVDKYFAYLELSGYRSGGLTTYPTTVLLSRQKCQATGQSKWKNARKAMYIKYSRFGYEEVPGCWNDLGEDVVTICEVWDTQGRPNEKGALTQACADFHSSRFADTSSLPRSAF